MSPAERYKLRREYYRQYYQKNKEKVTQQQRERYHRKKELARQRIKNWRAANKDKVRLSQKRYQQKYAEKIRAQRRKRYEKQVQRDAMRPSAAEVAAKLLARADHAVRYGYIGKLRAQG